MALTFAEHMLLDVVHGQRQRAGGEQKSHLWTRQSAAFDNQGFLPGQALLLIVWTPGRSSKARQVVQSGAAKAEPLMREIGAAAGQDTKFEPGEAVRVESVAGGKDRQHRPVAAFNEEGVSPIS